jgi:hypothetical protein
MGQVIMNKLILSMLLMNSALFADTLVYNCADIKSDDSMYFNIDFNSIHYVVQHRPYVFNYDSTKDTGNGVLVHIFSSGNIHYTVHQHASNPIEIYIDEYKKNKLSYEYKCKLSEIIPILEQPEIPITFKKVVNAKKLLQQQRRDKSISH